MKILGAIDGFAASGKSTIAHDLAEKTGYTHIDSGAMYAIFLPLSWGSWGKIKES